jgi:hypothetical protein
MYEIGVAALLIGAIVVTYEVMLRMEVWMATRVQDLTRRPGQMS